MRATFVLTVFGAPYRHLSRDIEPRFEPAGASDEL